MKYFKSLVIVPGLALPLRLNPPMVCGQTSDEFEGTRGQAL